MTVFGVLLRPHQEKAHPCEYMSYAKVQWETAPEIRGSIEFFSTIMKDLIINATGKLLKEYWIN